MGRNPCAPSIQTQLTDHLLLQISYACDLAQSTTQQHIMLWVLPADGCRARDQAPTIKPPNPKPPCKLMKPSLRLLSCNGRIKLECCTSASLCKLRSPEIASPRTTDQPNVNISEHCMAHLFCSAFASSQLRRVSRGSSEPRAMPAQVYQQHEAQHQS